MKFLGALLLILAVPANATSIEGPLFSFGCGGRGQAPCGFKFLPEDCGSWQNQRWLRSSHGHAYKEVRTNDREWCKKMCVKDKKCNAVSFVRTVKKRKQKHKGKCYMKQAGDTPHETRYNKNSDSLVLCDGCDNWSDNTGIPKSSNVEYIMTVTTADALWCLKKCMHMEQCSAVSFNKRSKKDNCTLKKISTAQKVTRASKGTRSFIICDRFPAPSQCNPGLTVLGTVCATKDDGACGMWLDGQKFGRGNVGGKGHTKRKSRDDCLDLCNKTKGCNGVTWHEARKRCALKSLEDDERATVHEGMSAYRVCPLASCGGVDEPVCKDQGEKKSACNKGLDNVDGTCKKPCGGDDQWPCNPTPSPTDCGKWASRKALTSAPFMEIAIDKQKCLKRCKDHPVCDGVTWNLASKQNCQLHRMRSGDKMGEGDSTSWGFLRCRDCGAWEATTDIPGYTIKTFKAKDFKQCMGVCAENKRCNAVTWEDEEGKCKLKRLRSGFKRQYEKDGISSFVFCSGLPLCKDGFSPKDGVCRPDCGQFNQPVCTGSDGKDYCHSELEPKDGTCKHKCGDEGSKPCSPIPSHEDCGKWVSKKKLSSSPYKKIFHHGRGQNACRKECNQRPECDGITVRWQRRKESTCQLHKMGPDDGMVKDSRRSKAYLLCKDCGVWEPAKKLTGRRIKTTLMENEHKCHNECLKEKQCNGAVWEHRKKQCSLMHLESGFKRVGNKSGSSAFVFCDGYPSCQKGLVVKDGQCKPDCGENGAACCSGNKCDEGHECHKGKCRPECGQEDGECCKSGTKCENDLRCHNGKCGTKCGQEDEQCCASGKRCDDGLECHQGKCRTECGDEGESCCASGKRCDDGLECHQGKCRTECGEEDQICCASGKRCDDGLECHQGKCRTECGDEGESCCASGKRCGDGLECHQGKCRTECGEEDQICCASGKHCDDGLECHQGKCRTECGDEGESCCASGKRCDDGLECQQGKCRTECGDEGENCCASGKRCGDGLDCHQGKCRTECGEEDQICCTSGKRCDDGLECHQGKCRTECGEEDQICCDGKHCDSGLHCDVSHCHDCGQLDETCCSDSTCLSDDLRCDGTHCKECGAAQQQACSGAGVLACNSGLEENSDGICQVPECGGPDRKACTTDEENCGQWLDGKDFECEELSTKHSSDRKNCQEECDKNKECTVATYHSSKDESMCTLKKCDGGSSSVAAETDDTQSYQFCQEPCKGDQDGKLVLVDGHCRRCGESEQHCCADDYCGSESLYCNDGKCTECGKKGSRLCYKGKACEDGLVPYENDICDCGGKYQNCCDGDCNENDLVCEGNSGSEFGQCQPCGGRYQTCCSGKKCDSDAFVCESTESTELGRCAPCGGEDGDDYQVCCANKHCNGQRTCQDDGRCAPCGDVNQVACSEPPCKEGCESGCKPGLMLDMHGNGQCVMAGTD